MPRKRTSSASAAAAPLTLSPQPLSLPPPPPPPSLLLTWAPILAWQLCSISVIFVNKHLYDTAAPLRLPLTNVVLHMLVSTLATQLFAALGWIAIPRLGWRIYLTVVVPLGVLFAGSIALSNLASACLPISSTQMLKALAPLFTLAAMFAAGMGKAQAALVPLVTCFALGGALVNLGDLNFDPQGLTLQLSALLCEALRMVAVKLTLDRHLKASPLVAVALFAPVCAACLLPLCLLREPTALAALAASPHLTHLAAASSLGALGLNCCNVWLLSQASGPLLLSLAGVVKDMAAVLLSRLMGNAITRVQTAGYALSLLGLTLYRAYMEPGGGELGMLGLLQRAARDPSTRLIGLGTLVIFVFAV